MQLLSKKKYSIELFFNSVIVLILSIFLLLPAINKTAEKYTHNILVSISDLDFKIPSPSVDQIENIKKLGSVDKVFPFYDTFATVEIDNGKKLKNNFVLIVPIQNKVEFPFSSNRLLIKGNNETKDGTVFVDYSFSKKNKVDVNTKLEIAIGNMNKEFSVSGIVNNFCDLLSSSEAQKNAILLFIDEKQLSSYLGKSISYSGAYVRCKDVNSFKQYLDSYKPYGRLKSAESFNSEQEYNDYLNYFNDGQYDAEILNLEIRNKLNTSNDGVRFSFIFAVLTLVLMLILNVLIITDKLLVSNSKELIQNGEDYISIKNEIKKILLILLCTSIAENIVLMVIFICNLSDYCSVISLTPIFLIAVFLPLVFGLLFVFISSSIVERRNKKTFDGIRDK